MQKNKIEDLLLEVRKSYRTLYIYQKRILDLVSFIGGKFGLSYNGGFSKFSNSSPKNGKGNLNLWSWDWLNMYYYEFYFGRYKRGNDEIIFSIFHLADDGFYKSKSTNNNLYKTNLSAFEDVAKSNTKLIFVIGKNFWEGWGEDWNITEFTLNEFGIKNKDANNLMLFKCYDLAKFQDEESCISTLIDFENLCKIHEIDFKINNRNF